MKEKIICQMCAHAANEERGRKNVRGAGRLAVVTRPAARDDPFEDQARVAAAGAGIHFWCVGGLCVTRLSRSGLVSCTWGWDDFRLGHLERMWRHPWQSAAVRTTLTHLLSWMPQELCTEVRSSLALQSQLYSSYKSRTTLKDLIGISPNSPIYFVSELWSGPISDRELVIRSVMFCLSKKLFIITFTSSVAFQPFFFYTFWLPSSVACWFAWLLHKHHQILFSFSSDKDRRTDNRIRRKKHSAAPPGIEPRILRILEFARSWVRFPAGLRCVFFVWSGCQFFYLCRSWKRREFD